MIVDECDSTNDLARELAMTGAPHGSWISARRQKRGRGRLGRVWQSDEGNLFLSVVLRPKRPEYNSWIPLIAGLAAVDALRDAEVQAVRIKWPNDLWLAGGKLGGILCEASRDAAGNGFVIAGVGINCAYAPRGLDQPTARLTACSAEELRPRLLQALLARFARLEREGAEAVEREFLAVSLFAPDSSIEWTEDDAPVHGKFLGLGPAGELRVMTPRGERLLYSADIRVTL